ncbi:MAG TPA: LodA/GoxA family CTQ-dependent oxidase [Pseudonocardiaceae bacterium]|nr:LodA/GoxA family CTQ-dependent oxidase [Pseudonocardiaceae bacterium]
MTATFEIHPAVGIARAGNSDDFFLGPEPEVVPPPRYRDGAGNLLRQAARFRIFQCDRADDGTLKSATEITAAKAHIEWTVHLVNAKGAAPEFPPPAVRPPQSGVRLRNAGHSNRADLVIDPGPRTVASPGQRAVFDSGAFLGTIVPLGEIRTDDDGRLLVLGGFGKSGFVSPDGSPVPINNFANNDNWYDDMSDGTVEASVSMGAAGPKVDAKPARVIVAPPDFAPGITNLVTLHDVAFQAAVRRGWRQVPDKPSFTIHVQPILRRVLGYQWVSQLGRQGHGPGAGMGDFASQWAALADPSPAHAAIRGRITGKLRDPAQQPAADDRGFMPRLHSSDFAAFPNGVLRLTPTQYAVLRQWAAGQFVNDLDHPPSGDELLPDALDRTALEACSGGPFFPGIEVGHIMADPQTYSEAFRVDAQTRPAGKLTEGNAVPWQADFLACSVDSQSQLGWWPAQRPYQVRTRLDSDTTQFWHRGVTGFRGMVDEWHELGVVVETRRADGQIVFVESERRSLPG